MYELFGGNPFDLMAEAGRTEKKIVTLVHTNIRS